MPDILDIAQLAVQAAMRNGAEFADASVGSGISVGVDLENSSLKECEVVRDYGIGVRAFYRGGMGTATTTSLSEEAARTVGRQAAEMAKATHGDPDFVCLPDPQPWEEVPGRWDDAVAGLPVGVVVQWCRAGIEEARQIAPEVALEGGAGLDYGEKAIASSTGVAYSTRGTSVDINFFAVVQRGDDVGAYFEFDAARRLEDFKPEGVARIATETALRFLGSRQIAKARMPLVLGPMAVSGLIGAVIGSSNAESVQRRRSFMVNRAGTQIAAPCLTVREEPFIPGGLSSTGIDGEGVPKRARALIDKGVLTTYLHNSYTANKEGVENTAHARRSGSSAGVGIGPSNLHIMPGNRTEKELIADIEDGLYIDYGGLQPDSTNGDISATVDFGFKIENGEIAYPVATTMVGTDVFEMLGNIEAVSSDYREEPGSITPSLRIRDIMIIGGA